MRWDQSSEGPSNVTQTAQSAAFGLGFGILSEGPQEKTLLMFGQARLVKYGAFVVSRPQ